MLQRLNLVALNKVLTKRLSNEILYLSEVSNMLVFSVMLAYGVIVGMTLAMIVEVTIYE